MKYAVGVDIGGTKIAITIAGSNGKILKKKVITTLKGPKVKQCLGELSWSIKELISASRVKRNQIVGIGVGVPGPVNAKAGIVPKSPHMRGWKGTPLVSFLKKEIKLPVTMANDANATALGEGIFGQAKGIDDFIYMTVSTGVGGGIVANGKLIQGSDYVGGEIGHMIVVPQGELCPCGHQGCLEAYASGTAMASFAQRELSVGMKSKYLKSGEVDGKALGYAAKQGDKLALDIFERGGFYLGIGLATLLNVINPKLITLGGGILKSAPPIFLEKAKKTCKRHAWPEAYKSVTIKRSKLGSSVGDLGALALAFDHFGS